MGQASMLRSAARPDWPDSLLIFPATPQQGDKTMDKQKNERLLQRFEPGRREAMRKILGGAALYSAPVVTSFSMNSLGGAAQAAPAYCANQTGGCATPVPTLSEEKQVGLMALLAAAGAYLLHRGR